MLRSAVQVGTVLRWLVVRGNRIMIFKFHGNCESVWNNYLTPLLTFPAHAFAGIFQNDTVPRQLVADAIGFCEIAILFCGDTLRDERVDFFVARAAGLAAPNPTARRRSASSSFRTAKTSSKPSIALRTTSASAALSLPDSMAIFVSRTSSKTAASAWAVFKSSAMPASKSSSALRTRAMIFASGFFVGGLSLHSGES